MLFQSENIFTGRYYFVALIIYHLILDVYAFFFLIQVLTENIFQLLFTIPIMLLIILSTIGIVKGFKGNYKAVNYFISVQLLQTILLQINGFTYFMLIGQWFVILINATTGMGIQFGFLNLRYSFLFHQENNFIIGVNFVPIAIILILLKVEEMRTATGKSIEVVQDYQI